MKNLLTSEIPTTIKNGDLVKKRRQQIFEAVVKLFSEKGYHSTTLREISKESDITLGNLYDYISTKEDTLSIIQEKAYEAVLTGIKDQKMDELNPVEKLKKLIIFELETMKAYEELILIIYQESHAMSKALLYSLLTSERRHIEQYERVIKDGIKKGLFKPNNVRMTANMIKMLIDSWIIKRWDLRGKVTLEEWKQGLFDIIFDGILSKREKNRVSIRKDKKDKNCFLSS